MYIFANKINHLAKSFERDIHDQLKNGHPNQTENLWFSKDDVEKYAAGNTMTVIIRYILKEGWAFAAQRIKLGSFAGSSYKSREMGEAFSALEKTILQELVYPTIHTMLQVNPELIRSPKLLWLDTGLIPFYYVGVLFQLLTNY